MHVPEALFTNLQRTIDSGETPPGIRLPDAPPFYKANIDDILTDTYRITAKGPHYPGRNFTPFELEHLRQSLPLLGFPRHRYITQGPHEGEVYAFKPAALLRSVKKAKFESRIFQIYHPTIRAGMWVSSLDILAGRWPRGLRILDCQPRTEAEVDADMDQIAGGHDRWRALTALRQSAYAMTDQARVYRIRPWLNGRDTNPSSGDRIPYEIAPYPVNGSHQIGLPPAPVDDEGTKLGVGRVYVRPLYAMVWGEGARPVLAARYYGTEPFNPYFDVAEEFIVKPRGRQQGGPPGITQQGPEPAADHGWDEDSSVSV